MLNEVFREPMNRKVGVRLLIFATMLVVVMIGFCLFRPADSELIERYFGIRVPETARVEGRDLSTFGLDGHVALVIRLGSLWM
jgi:hypothetical protein